MIKSLPPTLTLTLLALLLTAAPLPAQDVESPTEPPGSFERGLGKLSEGSRLLLEGILGELAPLVAQLNAMIDQMNAYEAPEMLPNGDIIIRRKREELPPPKDGEIDL